MPYNWLLEGGEMQMIKRKLKLAIQYKKMQKKTKESKYTGFHKDKFHYYCNIYKAVGFDIPINHYVLFYILISFLYAMLINQHKNIAKQT